MDFNVANSVLKKIRKEYRAFEQLEELIEFCIDLDHRKDGLQKSLADLAEMEHQTKVKLNDLMDQVRYADSALEVLHGDHARMSKALEAAHRNRMDSLDATYMMAKFSREAEFDSVVAEIDRKVDFLRALDTQIKHAEVKLDNAKAQFEAFKRNL